jgi:hypothetical protein
LTNGGQQQPLVDNTTGLTMLIINNLVEIFELAAASEPSALALLATIHRNASASALFIHSVSSSWPQVCARKRLYLLHACLKSLEGVHFSASGMLLNLLVDKFFHLPYLSLVRYADHIACQRVEMLQSLGGGDELHTQLTEHNITMLNKFFAEQFTYSYRHKRLIALLDQLRRTATTAAASSPPRTPPLVPLSQMKTSPSIDFFMLYTTPALATASLDKEWFYNMVRSACSYNSTAMGSSATTNGGVAMPASFLLKSRQCALMLSSLDYANVLSILQDKQLRLSVLKDCMLLGAHKTQLVWERLPSVFRNQSLHKVAADFIHPLWSASVKFFFELCGELCAGNKLPHPPQVTLPVDASQNSGDQDTSGEHELYEARLSQLLSKEVDFYSLIAPMTESINAYLKSIHQYPCLRATAATLSSKFCFHSFIDFFYAFEWSFCFEKSIHIYSKFPTKSNFKNPKKFDFNSIHVQNRESNFIGFILKNPIQ